MAEFYSARGWEIPPLPWTNLSPPFSHGEVVGAVGITGDVNEMDDECAFAGIRAAGFHVDPNQYDGDA